MAEVEEIASTLEDLRARTVDLVVRGLASVAPGDLTVLEALTDTYERSGLTHITSRLRAMLRAIPSDPPNAPTALLAAYTSLHVFERVLSLEAAVTAWQRAIASLDEDNDDNDNDNDIDDTRAPPAAPLAVVSAIAHLPPAEAKKLADLLDDLARAIEDLLRTGLTSATQATRDKLDVSFKEASRMKLLRLGTTLRYVNEEVGRFLARSDDFSARRFLFFTHRAWLLARGLAGALKENNDLLLARLSGAGGRPPTPVSSLHLVTLGVFARAVQSTCAFDFRLRVLAADDPALIGKTLVFGLVFGRKSMDIPAAAFLHLPQPQKYLPKLLAEPRIFTVTGAAIAPDERGGGRLLLGPRGTVTQQAAAPTTWEPYLTWDIHAALARAQAHLPSPLDLPNELQEEVCLRDWTCHEQPARATPERRVFLVTCAALELDVFIPTGGDGQPLAAHFDRFAKRKPDANAPPAPLYGLVHYELGRLVLTPLATFSSDGPNHLTLSTDKINLKALLRSLEM